MCQIAFMNFHFFHWFKLDLVKMAKLACDLLCQRMRCMRQHFASICGACGSMLLAYAAHTQANCQRRRRIRQQIASVCAAYGSTLLALTRMRQLKKDRNNVYIWSWLAQTAHAVALCQHVRLQIASVDDTVAPHTVALCQRRRHMRQLKQNGQYLTHL